MGATKIVVTGGSGFAGSHLIEELENHSFGRIINIDIKNRENWDLSDYAQAEYLLGKFKPDVVFDLATLPLPLSLIAPYEVVNVITQMALNLCELCRRGYFKTLVHISSSEAYGSCLHSPMDENHPLNPNTPYASAKASADLIVLSYVKTFGIDATIPRCFNIYGERQPISYGAIIPKTIHSILTGKQPEIYGDGEQARDFIYVKDMVRGIVEVYNCKETRGKVINIASGSYTTINHIVETICKLMKYKGKIIHTEPRVADVSKLCGDIEKAQKLFNFKPAFSLPEGLERPIKYYVNLQKNNKPTK